jgi:CheY-like chemotaxis protein
MIDVLVVDDNQDIAECMEFLLAIEGYRVRVAFDGRAGLSALSEGLPDVLILDVEMPVLDGPGMAHQMIVDNCGREAIPIVLTSAVSQLREIAARIGTPYYLAKPYQPSALLELVARSAQERIAPRPPIPPGKSPCKLG